jgi:hypothetical protein
VIHLALVLATLLAVDTARVWPLAVHDVLVTLWWATGSIAVIAGADYTLQARLQYQAHDSKP